MSQDMLITQLSLLVWLFILLIVFLPESIQTGSTDVYDQPYGHKYCNATLESISNCTLYYNQSVTFVCVCVDKQCSNTWKLWRRNNVTVLSHMGQQYTTNVVTGFNPDSITCESNNQTLYKWTINILQSSTPMFLVDLTEDGYFFNDDVLSFIIEDNSTCIVCIDCSVTGSPVPTVTWSYHSNDSQFTTPIITNDSNSKSGIFIFDNGQKLCFSNIGNYLGHQYEYECSAVNVVGNTSAIFGFDRDDTLDFLRPGKLASKLQTYFIDDGANVTLVMDTDYFEEVAFRACRYDLSSLNQSVSCCDCNKSVKCEWGVLENSSSPQPVCQLWTSQLGLYQFTIYTGQFPCYLNIGTPFEIHERLSHERSSDYHIEIVYSITTSVFTAMILLLLVLIVIVARYKRMQRFHVRNAFPSSKSLLELTHVYNDDVDNDVVNNDDADNDDNDNMSLPTAVGYLLYEQQKTSVIIKNKENCPLRDFQIISKVFDYDGGDLLIKEYAVKVTVPIGAIDKDCKVQIKVAASLFGPFTIPKDYYPISVYVWIGACYEFKKKLKIEMEHDIVVSEETNISELCVLTACEEDKFYGENSQILYNMHEDACEYHYELNKSTCTFFASHFCSKCLAAKGKANKPRRIIMYHYLPKDYKSAYEFVAEVCLCYDLNFCTERTEERYSNRGMQQVFSTFICIFNWRKDKIIILYRDKLENWEICHLGVNEIEAIALDFRFWYKSLDKLRRDEENDLFPPRFRLKMVNKDYHLSTCNLVYTYKICIQSKKREDKHLVLNVSGFGQEILNKKGTIKEQLDQDQLISASSQQQLHIQALKQQSNFLCSQQPDQHQSAAATSQQQSTESQDSQALALEQHLTSFGNPQQLQSALQTTDRTTNITYILATKGDNNTISLPSTDGPPSVKTTFNSLQPFTDVIAGSVNMDVILPMMMQQGLVSPEQQQDLINPSMAAKQQKLCGIILGLPEGCVKKFLHCLLKTNHYEPHKQLYDELYKHLHITKL